VSKYLLLQRSTIEAVVDLLEKVESPYPNDLFVYLDILHKLKTEMHKIDIHVRIEKNVQINGSLPKHSYVELYYLLNQLGVASAASAVC